MGLDMYLSKQVFIGHDERDRLDISGTDHSITTENVEYIVEQAGYWRKANAIHNWFVEHVQDHVDNCATYFVSERKLKELLDTVNTVLHASELVDGKVYNGTTFHDGKTEEMWVTGKVIKDPTLAKELLPTGSGFFFGGTDYDEGYYLDLVDTKRILTEALEGPDSGADFYYQSSW